MIIKNVKRYTDENKFVDGEIYIKEDLFLSEEEIGQEIEIIDGEGCYAIPGLIDLHFHGCKGYDVCDGTKEAIEEIAKYEASIGVTAICPATMTLPVDELNDILATAAEYKKEQENEETVKADAQVSARVREYDYRLGLMENQIVVYRGDESQIYEYTNLILQHLPYEEQRKILLGQGLYTEQELYEFLETYSS